MERGITTIPVVDELTGDLPGGAHRHGRLLAPGGGRVGSEFLNESELTERRAFVEIFVEEVVVMPDNALMRCTVP